MSSCCTASIGGANDTRSEPHCQRRRAHSQIAAPRAINELVRFGLPDDYWAKYPAAVQSLDKPKVDAAAKEVVNAGGLIWVVVGDRAKIEAGIRELNLGKVSIMDADGNVVQ